MRQARAIYKDEIAGTLTQLDDGSFVFRYADAWWSSSDKPAISLTLPKSQQEYRSEYLFPFFFHLLPEGTNKEAVCFALRIDREDHFGLLLHTATHDTIGAVRVQKIAQEDFASLAERTPQTHGEHYKYQGNYYQLFELLQKHVPAYKVEALKLFKLILFNYISSNGDAHFKNFSLIETSWGDFKLSPAYDLLNSRIHMDDLDFALEQELLPDQLKKGGIIGHFYVLGELARLTKKQVDRIVNQLRSKQEKVLDLIQASFLDEASKRTYRQHY